MRRSPLRAVPAEMGELAEGEQHDGRAAKQEHEAEHAVDDGPAGQHVAGKRVVGKIVGVGMRSAGPRGGRRPRGPGKERGQLAQLLRIGDQLHGQAAVVGRRHEIVRPVGNLTLERVGVRRTQGQGTGRGVVAVLLHRPRDAAVDLASLFRGQLAIGSPESRLRGMIGDVEGPVVQVLRREVGAEIGAMAPYRAIGHEAVLEEDLLARDDVIAGEDDGAAGIDGPRRNWRCLAVGLDGQSDQNRKAEYHRDDGCDLPPDRKRAARRSLCHRHRRSPWLGISPRSSVPVRRPERGSLFWL